MVSFRPVRGLFSTVSTLIVGREYSPPVSWKFFVSNRVPGRGGWTLSASCFWMLGKWKRVSGAREGPGWITFEFVPRPGLRASPHELWADRGSVVLRPASDPEQVVARPDVFHFAGLGCQRRLPSKNTKRAWHGSAYHQRRQAEAIVRHRKKRLFMRMNRS